MKFLWLTPILLTVALGKALLVSSAIAADSPPTPKLQKADKPLIDLGSEVSPTNANSNTRATTPANLTPPKNTSPVKVLKTNSNSDTRPIPSTEKNESKVAKNKDVKQWSYSGEGSPQNWGDLSKENILCKEGKNQSPIDLRDNHALGTTGLAELEIRYRDVPLKTINNGYRLQVNYPLGSYIKLDNKRYELMHFNFHTPSEHQKEGFNYPMEVQLVHRDGDYNFVVIGVLFQEGEENPSLQTLLNNLPKEINKETIHRGAQLNPVMFIPTNTEFYKYSGSLTTPPCSEGVYWMVFKQPIEASAEQIQRMNEIMGDNSRPVQPTNARNILKSWSEGLQEPPPLYEFY